jgi:hypothetical protein
MKSIVPDPGHAGHRAKVGMIGLAAVLLLIGLAAAVFATATKDRPLVLAGNAHAQAEHRIADNATAPSDKATNEPLAELGVAPSAPSVNVSAAVTPNAATAK